MRDAARRPMRRILLIQMKWMGDVILTTPAIRLLRRAYPDARIDLLTRPPGAAAVEGNPYLDEVLVFRRGRENTARMVRELARRRYDAVIDFRSTIRDTLFAVASRAPLRVGVQDSGLRRVLYTHTFPKERDGVYLARQKMELLRPLGIEAGATRQLALDVVVGAAEHAWAERILERLGLTGEEPIVAFSAVGRLPFKRWPAERWAEVADAVAARGARVLFTHGPGEREQVRAVVERMRRPAAWDYEPGSPRQLAALYERCVLWVGNDGGPKHIAAAAGTPTISVMRWSIGSVWADTGAGVSDLYLEALPVLPCNPRRCGQCAHLSCLVELKTESVAAVVLRRLEDVAPELARRPDGAASAPAVKGPRRARARST
ncbi:MAG TPA: glycosyltransferase family 9 protein [Longimicrobiales bacterium]|nr:glycosyltransferase family 9 protein [Longimicrobiales bacterium]